MIRKIFIMSLAFVLMVVGLTYIIIYINLFTFGYTIKEYVYFITHHFECYLLLLGLIIEIICIYS